MKVVAKEIGRTIRAAMAGWAPTFRLILLLIVLAAIWTILMQP